MKLEIFQYFLDFNLLSCMDTVKNIVLTQLDHIKKNLKHTLFVSFFIILRGRILNIFQKKLVKKKRFKKLTILNHST